MQNFHLASVVARVPPVPCTRPACPLSARTRPGSIQLAARLPAGPLRALPLPGGALYCELNKPRFETVPQGTAFAPEHEHPPPSCKRKSGSNWGSRHRSWSSIPPLLFHIHWSLISGKVWGDMQFKSPFLTFGSSHEQNCLHFHEESWKQASTLGIVEAQRRYLKVVAVREGHSCLREPISKETDNDTLLPPYKFCYRKCSALKRLWVKETTNPPL